MKHPFSQMLLVLTALLPVPLTALQAAETPKPAKPNLIFILTDDQGYGELSCHGNPILKTPHLDRLHAESVRFSDFHVAPMCTPTRGQLMSGIDCLRNGAMNVSSGRVFLRRGLPTMADVFAAGGYRCGQFGKWHLGDNYPYRPHDRGFHEAIYYPSSHISFLDQGRQVRDGLRRNSAWNVIVDHADDYVFELGCWPREAKAALAAGLMRAHTPSPKSMPLETATAAHE